MDTFFGHPRPEIVCSSRIDLRVPLSASQGPHGRPIKVWTGSSDAEESQVYLAICENALLARLVRSRKLAPEGFLMLKGTLSHEEGPQAIQKLDLDFQYVELDSRGAGSLDTEWMQKAFDTFVRGMTELKKTHDDGMARMSEAFSSGMGKITKHSKDIGKVARRLERDRASLNAALLRVLENKSPQATGVKSTLETGIQALTLLKDFSPKGGNDGGKTEV